MGVLLLCSLLATASLVKGAGLHPQSEGFHHTTALAGGGSVSHSYVQHNTNVNPTYDGSGDYIHQEPGRIPYRSGAYGRVYGGGLAAYHHPAGLGVGGVLGHHAIGHTVVSSPAIAGAVAHHPVGVAGYGAGLGYLGAGYGLGYGAGYGLGYLGAGHGLAYGAGHGLAYGTGHGLAYGAGYGLGSLAGHGLAYGAGYGLGSLGAGHGLAYGTGYGLGYGLGHTVVSRPAVAGSVVTHHPAGVVGYGAGYGLGYGAGLGLGYYGAGYGHGYYGGAVTHHPVSTVAHTGVVGAYPAAAAILHKK